MDQDPAVSLRGRFARRAVLAGSAAAALLALPGCESLGRYRLVEAVRRLLQLSSERAFARLIEPDGFWDDQLARLKLPDMLGSRGTILQALLTSPALKDRLQHEFNRVAARGARRAAPIVAETVRTIGIDNAVALVRGGPTAGTTYLRGAMAGSLIDAMAPELGDALRVSQEPLIGQALSVLTGVDVSGLARDFAGEVDDAIWGAIGREESAIRANPRETHDPVLIAVFSAP